MNNQHLLCTVMFTLLFLHPFAQQKSYNQNQARSNHTRSFINTNDAWNFGLNSGGAFALKSNENTLFRGNSLASKFMGQYYFGPVGIGLNGGIISGNFSTQAIDAFITDRKFTGSTFTTTNPFNGYLLLGPSLRLGQRIQLIAEIKGGMFFNQGGSLTIAQQGAVRPLYRFEAGNKNLFPGFNGGLSIAYPVGNSSSIMLTGDYMHSSSSVRMYDPQRGIDVPVELKKKMQLFTAGISFVKTFEIKSPRDAASGQASGKRTHEIKTPRDAASGQASGKMATTNDDGGSIINPDKPALIKSKTKSNQSNDRTTNPACGPVTVKTTNTDGTTDEMTFACPDDAVNYKTAINSINNGMPNRISMNVTVPKQTQGATFGEKVNQGLHAAGGALAQGAALKQNIIHRDLAARNIISGKIIHSAGGGSGGIVTNAAVSGVSALSGGSGAASASYAATGRMAGSNTPIIKGAAVHFYAREAGSGMATGRRQYKPAYFDGQTQTEVCNPCMATISNPLYTGTKNEGTNPLHKENRMAADGGDDDCDGLAEGFDVMLIDRTTGAVVASTKTNHCGEYFFANVPDGAYTVEVSGASTIGKQYNVSLTGEKTDVAGEIVASSEIWQHILYNNNPNQRAGISTSRSNIRDKRSITVTTGDTDSDGAPDFFRVMAEFTDGTSGDISSQCTINNTSPKTIIIPFENQNQKASINTTRSNIKHLSISVNDQGAIDKAFAIFADGTSREVTQLANIKPHPNVVQLTIATGDVDGDGAADLIWSPRSNVCISAKSSAENKDEIDESVFTATDAFISNLPIAVGDLDGDGVSEIIAGKKKTYFENGDIPTEEQRQQGASLLGGALPGGSVISSALRPGNPIGGISIKGGKNPGGNLRTVTTNELGEFEFPGLTKGDYTFSTETRYIISDETDVDVISNDTTTERKGDVKITASQNSQSLKTTVPKQTQGTSFGEKVNAGLASVSSLTQTLDDIDEKLNNDQTSARAGISTSRSNIRNVKSTLAAIQADLANNNITEAQAKMQTLNNQLLSLQQSLQNLGNQYTSISNVLKTKHDTVKNSISNIR